MRNKTLFISIITLLVLAVPVAAQTPDFTYQGSLNNGGTAANGSYDIRFELYTAASGGTLLNTVTRLGVTVTNGAFTAVLDFPAPTPKKELLLPVVLTSPAWAPTKVLTLPVVLAFPAFAPTKVLIVPVVVFCPANAPKNELLSAALA